MYPALEIAMGGLFVLTGAWLIDPAEFLTGDTAELTRLLFLLAVAFVAIVTVFYDFLFKEISDEVLIPGIVLTGILLIALPQDTPLFRHFEPVSSGDGFLSNWMNGFFGALAIYTFFYLQFLIPAGIHYARKKAWKDVGMIAWYYVWLPFSVTAELFKKKAPVRQEEEEPPTWIGLGDLRIAIFMGFVGGLKITVLGVFFAYLIGSVAGLYFILVARQRNVRVPFGPFLLAGFYVSLLWYPKAVEMIFPNLP